jgi:hypothetical protein
MILRALQLLALLPALVLADGVGTRLTVVVRGQTNETTHKTRLARQREISDWFHEHNRHVPSEAKCKTEADRRNARDFHAVMSNFQLLALPKRDRLKAEAALQAYADAVSTHGEAALRSLFSPLPPELLARWQQPPTVKAACLGGIVRFAPAAVYVPTSQTMYLDFNQAIEPAVFADAFEHELWHHLVPSVKPPDVARNLFWEGFNEALSELWGSELRRRMDGKAMADGPVRYPVAAALASLCFAADRNATLQWLLGRLPRKEFAQSLAPHLPRLAAEFAAYPALSPERKTRIEAVLADWNWREDDGTPPRIDTFLEGNAIAAERVRTAFRLNRRYLDVFIDAQAVIWLQEAAKDSGKQRLLKLAREHLPDPLVANLRRTLNYIRDPASPLR